MNRTHQKSLSEVRNQLGTLIDQARDEQTPIYITRHGHDVAALIDANELDQLIELAEDMEDIRAAALARKEMAETKNAPIPWEDVKADLGLA